MSPQGNESSYHQRRLFLEGKKGSKRQRQLR
jgi:hypothetical protein